MATNVGGIHLIPPQIDSELLKYDRDENRHLLVVERVR